MSRGRYYFTRKPRHPWEKNPPKPLEGFAAGMHHLAGVLESNTDYEIKSMQLDRLRKQKEFEERENKLEEKFPNIKILGNADRSQKRLI